MLISGSVRHKRTPSCSAVVRFGGIAKSSHRLAVRTIREIILAGTPTTQETGEQFAYWSDCRSNLAGNGDVAPRTSARRDAGWISRELKMSRTNRGLALLNPPSQPGGFFFGFCRAWRPVDGAAFVPTFFGAFDTIGRVKREAHRCSKRLLR
jgi:hypothetical protein